MLENAKALCSNQTEAEQRLWYHLRAHRFMNLKLKETLKNPSVGFSETKTKKCDFSPMEPLINQRFIKRQKPIGHYIVDFVCLEHRLIIEIDGGQHSEQVAYDQHRDAWLRSQGYTVLRFWNNDVMQPLEGVLEQIRPLPQSLSYKWERGMNAQHQL